MLAGGNTTKGYQRGYSYTFQLRGFLGHVWAEPSYYGIKYVGSSENRVPQTCCVCHLFSLLKLETAINHFQPVSQILQISCFRNLHHIVFGVASLSCLKGIEKLQNLSPNGGLVVSICDLGATENGVYTTKKCNFNGENSVKIGGNSGKIKRNTDLTYNRLEQPWLWLVNSLKKFKCWWWIPYKNPMFSWWISPEIPSFSW